MPDAADADRGGRTAANPRPIGRRGMRNPLTGMRLPARSFRKLPKAANSNDILELM